MMLKLAPFEPFENSASTWKVVEKRGIPADIGHKALMPYVLKEWRGRVRDDSPLKWSFATPFECRQSLK